MKVNSLIKIVIIILVIALIIPTVLGTIVLFGTDFFKEEPLYIAQIEHFTLRLNNLKTVKIGIVFTQTLPALLGAYLYVNEDKKNLNWVGITVFLLLMIAIICSLLNLIYFDESIEHQLEYGLEYVNTMVKFSDEILKISLVYFFSIIGITIKIKP